MREKTDAGEFRLGVRRYNMAPETYKPILRRPNHGDCMAILKIARMGHPVLLRRCDPVADPGAPEIRRLVTDMMETMEDAPGVGLAAPQVFQPLRLFVFRVPGGRATSDGDDTPQSNTVLINPSVELLGDEREMGWEGCLSIPELRAAV